MSKTIEQRSCELRAATDADFCLVGYAAKFGVLSKDIPAGTLGKFNEQIKRGAFRKVLATKPDVRCLFNHNADVVLGRTTAGTLTLDSDDIGLRFRCQLCPDNTQHASIYSSVRRGDISECSFAFQLEPGDDSYENISGHQVRTIKNVSHLYDVSVVTTPAYDGTSVAARALTPQRNEDLRAQAARQSTEIALMLRSNPNIAAAIRNGISIEKYEDAELRLRAAELARKIWEEN